jgi:DNA-binding response OmpR family regulator
VKTTETCVVRRVTIAIDGTRPIQTPRTVLLVTGDDDLRQAAARALAVTGYKVVTASHSGHAILAAMAGGPIDWLLAELAMDDGSGPSLAARVRRFHPAVQSLFFANAGTPECEGVLVRPFTRDDLLGQLAAQGVNESHSQLPTSNLFG